MTPRNPWGNITYMSIYHNAGIWSMDSKYFVRCSKTYRTMSYLLYARDMLLGASAFVRLIYYDVDIYLLDFVWTMIHHDNFAIHADHLKYNLYRATRHTYLTRSMSDGWHRKTNGLGFMSRLDQPSVYAKKAQAGHDVSRGNVGQPMEWPASFLPF